MGLLVCGQGGWGQALPRRKWPVSTDVGVEAGKWSWPRVHQAGGTARAKARRPGWKGREAGGCRSRGGSKRCRQGAGASG